MMAGLVFETVLHDRDGSKIERKSRDNSSILYSILPIKIKRKMLLN